MTTTLGRTTELVQRGLNKLPTANSSVGRQAREELIEQSGRRMKDICRKMFFKSLSGSPLDWEDVYQEAAIRLWKSLDAVRPATVPEFFGLACKQIRRVLLDMCRKYAKTHCNMFTDPEQPSFSAERLAMWSEFHEQVDKLPDVMRNVVDLCWYQGLTQKKAAALLGVNVKTVKRRWREARMLLKKVVI